MHHELVFGLREAIIISLGLLNHEFCIRSVYSGGDRSKLLQYGWFYTSSESAVSLASLLDQKEEPESLGSNTIFISKSHFEGGSHHLSRLVHILESDCLSGLTSTMSLQIVQTVVGLSKASEFQSHSGTAAIQD